MQLKKCRQLYSKYEKTNYDLFKLIKNINENILKEKHSKHEAFFIPIYFMIRLKKPDIVIETGTHRGVSSLFILQALEDNAKGMLYSIDLPFAKYEVKDGITTKSDLPTEKIGICVLKSLKNRWNLILGDSKQELPKLLETLPSVDFFLHDSQHTYEHMMWEFETIWPKLIKSGILMSDDIHWNEAFNIFSTKTENETLILQRSHTAGKFGVIIKK